MKNGRDRRNEELRLVLLGRTGSGKSASGNRILGRRAFLSRPSASSVTEVCQVGTAELTEDEDGQRRTRRVTVIDTPGYGNTSLDEEQTRTETAKCVSLSAPGPHAFLLVVPIGQYTASENQAVCELARMFGEDAVCHHTVVLLTRGDDLQGLEIEEYLRRAPAGLRSVIERCGGRYHVFNNREPSNTQQVEELLRTVDNMASQHGFYTNAMYVEVKAAIREEEEMLRRRRRRRNPGGEGEEDVGVERLPEERSGMLNHLKRHKENQAKIQELNTQIQALMQMNGSSPAGRKQPSAPEGSQARSRACRRLPQGKREPAEPQEGSRDQRPFACDQCGRTYRHAGSLVNHRNSHKTGEYYCSVCNNSYSNRLAMKNHMRTHFAYKKHSCQSCGKAFRGEKQLLAHVCAELRKKGTVGRRGLRSRTRKCQHCKQAFWSAEQLRDHVCSGPAGASDAQASISTGKEERPFTCNICNRSYRHAGSLLNHKNTHKTGHFSCTFCSKPFTNPMALRNHTRIHTQRKKYVCLTCGKAFRLASILHNHQRTHSRAAAHLSCPGCGKSFQGRSGLKRHRCHGGQDSGGAGSQQPDPGDKCFMCDLCGRSYRHAGSLLNHKKTHSESLHHCALCLQTFPDPQALQIHSQMKRHCCPECGKTFCLPAHLQSHMDVHLKELSVVCGTCQQRFPNAASYQQHRDAQHKAPEPYPQAAGRGPTTAPWGSGVDGAAGVGRQAPPPLSHLPQSISDLHGDTGAHAEEKSHVCEHCGRTYRHAGSLLNHKNSHKTGFFFCSVCQKEFTNLMALKNHRRIHTEPKRYQCVECGKAFRVSTQLICHRRIHTKEKPFACLQCSKSFSSKSNLRHHQKMHQSSPAYDSSFCMDDDAFMGLDMEALL